MLKRFLVMESVDLEVSSILRKQGISGIEETYSVEKKKRINVNSIINI